MEVLLDSSFIISCTKKKIDFISQLEEQGFKIILPREVYQELKDLKKKVTHHSDREAIDTALNIFSSKNIRKATLGNKNVDEGLIEMGKKGAYIATLDKGIKNIVPRKIVIFDAQKRVGIE